MKILSTIYFVTFYIQIQYLFNFNLSWLLSLVNEESFIVNIEETQIIFLQLGNSVIAFAIQTFIGLALLFVAKKMIPLRYWILGTFIISNYLWLLIMISNIFNISTNYFLFQVINLLILFAPFLFTSLIIDTLHYVRTDEEMIETGFDRIPNTAIIIRQSLSTLSLFLLFIFFINLNFLETNLIYIYSTVIFGLIFVAKALFDLIHFQNSTKEKKLEIRQRKGYFAKAFDIHEYGYAHLGLTKLPRIGIDKSEIYNSAHNFELTKLKKLLKDEPQRVNEKNTYGWTAFMILVANTSHSSNRDMRLREEVFKFLEWLLDVGADININNYLRRNALVFAINYNDSEMVKFLLKNDAEVEDDMIEHALNKRYMEVYTLLKSHNS